MDIELKNIADEKDIVLDISKGISLNIMN